MYQVVKASANLILKKYFKGWGLMMSYRKAQRLFQILWMCYVITFGLSVNAKKTLYKPLSFSFSDCRCVINTFWHNLRKQYWKLFSMPLGWQTCLFLHSPHFVATDIPPNPFPILYLSLYRMTYFYTFLHKLPSPLHRRGDVVACLPTVKLLWRFLTQNSNLTLAFCSL